MKKVIYALLMLAVIYASLRCANYVFSHCCQPRPTLYAM